MPGIADDVELLETVHRLGIRIGAVAHFGRSAFADGSGEDSRGQQAHPHRNPGARGDGARRHDLRHQPSRSGRSRSTCSRSPHTARHGHSIPRRVRCSTTTDNLTDAQIAGVAESGGSRVRQLLRALPARERLHDRHPDRPLRAGGVGRRDRARRDGVGLRPRGARGHDGPVLRADDDRGSPRRPVPPRTRGPDRASARDRGSAAPRLAGGGHPRRCWAATCDASSGRSSPSPPAPERHEVSFLATSTIAAQESGMTLAFSWFTAIGWWLSRQPDDIAEPLRRTP